MAEIRDFQRSSKPPPWPRPLPHQPASAWMRRQFVVAGTLLALAVVFASPVPIDGRPRIACVAMT